MKQHASVHDPTHAVDKKNKKKKDEEDSSKTKTAHQIQKEMEKWAKRQEKIKMTFKQPEGKAQPASAGAGGSVKTDVGKVDETAQKPWADNDDDEEELPPPPDAVLPGRMRNVGVALNATSSRTSTSSSHGDAAAALATATAAAEEQFDEERYVDRAKNACMLCRRQFPSTEVLQKHISMSDLHKTNLAAKRKEFVTSSVAASTALSYSGGNKPYRDRAKERRAVYGLDPTGLSNEPGDDQADPAEAERIAAMKAAVPLDESNVGNRLLKSMGWSEGRGLGKDLQGIVNPIAAEQRVQGVGLGATGSKLTPSLSRRERGRQATLARYNELQD